ncbi:hypothetical protein D1007_42596 [Hordeum vulgare]|nr:hypothetical protein D1007_42596 [Hordeum vulgare]
MRAHAEEVRRRQEKLTPEQRRNPVYDADYPNQYAWFMWEHEEQRQRGVRNVAVGPPPPIVVREEDQEAKATYQNAVAAILRASEEEARQKEEKEEEAAYEK